MANRERRRAKGKSQITEGKWRADFWVKFLEMICILRESATEEQIKEMSMALEFYIKVAVDIRQGILAGGGELHADCEAALIKEGSRQEDIWGADWIAATKEVHYEALINIRPAQNNLSMTVINPDIRMRVKEITARLLGSSQQGD